MPMINPIPVRYNINAPTDSKVEIVFYTNDLQNLQQALAPAAGGRVIAVSDTTTEEGQNVFVYHVQLP